MMKKILIAISLLFVAAGIVCRFLLLDISLEYDEIFTAVTANPALALTDIWKDFLIVDVHPPLHNFLLWLYNHIAPYNGSELLLRLPSLVLSLLGLWLAWKFFPRYLGKTVRWLFMLQLVSNFYLLLYAQHARAYSLLLCLAIPLTFLYLQMARQIYQKRPIARHWWIAYGILSLLLCWSHYFGALLFGLFSIYLLIYAWRYKAPLRWFIIIPFAVLLCFLPWFIPNLLYNVGQHRFSGNWWGNQLPVTWHTLRLWVEFFFCTRPSFGLLLGIIFCSIFYLRSHPCKYRHLPYLREIKLVFFPLSSALLLIWLISFKINWVMWRYFFPFIPCLYLLVSLLIVPACRRYKICFLLFLVFIGINFYFYSKVSVSMRQGAFFSARPAMDIYHEVFADKDLYTVSLDSFPPSSMKAMYSFYPHYHYKMTNPVYELFYMNPTQREKLLDRMDQALIWIPRCSPNRMDTLTHSWQRSMIIFGRIYDNCFVLIADKKNPTRVDPKVVQQYQQRFIQYMQTHYPQQGLASPYPNWQQEQERNVLSLSNIVK